MDWTDWFLYFGELFIQNPEGVHVCLFQAQLKGGDEGFVARGFIY